MKVLDNESSTKFASCQTGEFQTEQDLDTLDT